MNFIDHVLPDQNEEASYIIYQQGNEYIVKNGKTGFIEFRNTDASTVIQQTLNNLTSARTWKERVILKGNFVISSTINIPSFTIFEVQGKLSLPNNATHDMINIQNQNDIEIVNGVYDGNIAGGTTSEAIIKLITAKNIIIRGIKVINFPVRGIMLYSSSTDNINIIIRDSIFTNVGAGLINFGWAISGSQINGCIIEYIYSDNVRNDTIDISGQNIHIKNVISVNSYGCVALTGTNSIIENCLADMTVSTFYAFVIGSDSSGIRSSKIIVRNNYVYGGRGGIFIQQTDTSDIIDNFIFNSVSDAGIAAVAINTGVSDLNIKGNTIINCLSGIYVTGDKCTICDNQIYSSLHEGLQIYNANHIIITRNRIIGNGYDGIFINTNCNHITVQDNMILNNNQGNNPTNNSGIDIYNSTNILIIGNISTDNQATKTQKYGIKLAGTTDNCIIIGNNVIGNTVGGITVTGTANIIKSNKGYITENSGRAIFSGNGTQTTFTIPHGLVATPTSYRVEAASSDAKGDKYVTADATNLYVTFATAPPAGTNNVVLVWQAEV
jgi:hypothetical protein